MIACVGSGSSQVLSVDWSRVSVDVGSDQAAFGPRVEVDEDILDVSKMEGYYANSDGFYGRMEHSEYVLVRRGEHGRIEALKLVGDANVPRGQLTWRTAPGQVETPTPQMFIQLQLRDNPNDPHGFEWSPGQHVVEWDVSGDEDTYPRFFVHGTNPMSSTGTFYRVDELVAVEAARTQQDAP